MLKDEFIQLFPEKQGAFRLNYYCYMLALKEYMIKSLMLIDIREYFCHLFHLQTIKTNEALKLKVNNSLKL